MRHRMVIRVCFVPAGGKALRHQFWRKQTAEEFRLWKDKSIESSREMVISFTRFVAEQWLH